jgi:hypothetical protein
MTSQVIEMIKTNISTPLEATAGIIGTAERGPAFVPVAFSAEDDFQLKFGKIDGSAFGPLAVKEWSRHGGATTYVRLLGAGDCKARTTTGDNAGKVTNAGFVVGSELVQSSSGMLGPNPYATQQGISGRTYFLGCFMSESEGSTIFSDAGMSHPDITGSIPIIRGMIMSPSGVLLSLNSAVANHNNPNSIASGAFGYNTETSTLMDGGLSFGDVFTKDIYGKEQSFRDFVMILNGFKKHSDVVISPDGETVITSYTNSITASLDPKSVNYFANKLNRDPTKIEKHGYYLHTHFDIDTTLAEVTGS